MTTKEQEAFKERYVETLEDNFLLMSRRKEDWCFRMPWSMPKIIISKYLYVHGNHCFIKKGWIFDGASGISVDSLNTIRGSAIHDVYCKILEQFPDTYFNRLQADKEYYKILREDGMSWIRAKNQYLWIRGYVKFLK